MKSNRLYWSPMINTYWSIILLINLAHRQYSTLSCGLFAQLVDWRSQCHVATFVLIFSQGNGYYRINIHCTLTERDF